VTKREYYDLLVKCCDDGTFPSVNPGGACAYRGPDDKRCAVGVLIPDAAWEKVKHLTFSNWHGTHPANVSPVELLAGPLLDAGFDLAAAVEDLTVEDLRRVQYTHDEAAHRHPAGGPEFKAAFLAGLETRGVFEGV